MFEADFSTVSKPYERDMENLDALQEEYNYVFVGLLNISQLRRNQARIASKGLLTLLKTNTMMQNAIYAQRKPTKTENRLLDLLSCIIQNVSLHPSNRTRCVMAPQA